MAFSFSFLCKITLIFFRREEKRKRKTVRGHFSFFFFNFSFFLRLQNHSNSGAATIDFLPPAVCDVHASCFETAKRALDAAKAGDIGGIRKIGPSDDSAHATGYHCAGIDSVDGSSMSRYNWHREGFVFSDGEMFDVEIPEVDNGTHQQRQFQSDMQKFFASMHDAMATNVLRAVARNLGCQDEDWFANKLGPTDKSSQWHVKRYVPICPTDTATDDGMGHCKKEKNERNESQRERGGEKDIWLPVHTDPSLISIVLHDAPGKREGAMGLQYQIPDPSSHQKRIWVELPWHGHAIATVLVGSVLSYITGNVFPGAKHRVVCRLPTTDEETERVAATLFVRPRGDRMLLVPPSPLLLTDTGANSVKIRNATFNDWNARVSRNYMKGRRDPTKGS